MWHRFLQFAAISGVTARRWGSTEAFPHFRGLPLPVLDVTVEKGEAAALRMPVCRQGLPAHRVGGTAASDPPRLLDDEEAGGDALLVFIYEGPRVRRML